MKQPLTNYTQIKALKKIKAYHGFLSEAGSADENNVKGELFLLSLTEISGDVIEQPCSELVEVVVIKSYFLPLHLNVPMTLMVCF